jgi:hypothetical protein
MMPASRWENQLAMHPHAEIMRNWPVAPLACVAVVVVVVVVVVVHTHARSHRARASTATSRGARWRGPDAPVRSSVYVPKHSISINLTLRTISGQSQQSRDSPRTPLGLFWDSSGTVLGLSGSITRW